MVVSAKGRGASVYRSREEKNWTLLHLTGCPFLFDFMNLLLFLAAWPSRAALYVYAAMLGLGTNFMSAGLSIHRADLTLKDSDECEAQSFPKQSKSNKADHTEAACQET